MTAKQVGPLMGIVFVLCVIVAFLVGGETPSVDDSTQKIVSFYTDNDTDQFISAIALWLGAIAFLFFLGSLRQVLRAADGDNGGLSMVVVLGGLSLAIGATIFAGLTLALADAADDMPATATVALNTLNSDMFPTVAVGTAVFNLALALAILRHGGLPRALGWAALVVGIVGTIPAPTAFFAFLASFIVIAWTSVALTMKVGATETPAAPPAAAL